MHRLKKKNKKNLELCSRCAAWCTNLQTKWKLQLLNFHSITLFFCCFFPLLFCFLLTLRLSFFVPVIGLRATEAHLWGLPTPDLRMLILSLFPWDCSWHTVSKLHTKRFESDVTFKTPIALCVLSRLPKLFVIMHHYTMWIKCGHLRPLICSAPSLTRPWRWGLDHNTAEQGKKWEN